MMYIKRCQNFSIKKKAEANHDQVEMGQRKEFEENCRRLKHSNSTSGTMKVGVHLDDFWHLVLSGHVEYLSVKPKKAW